MCNELMVSLHFLVVRYLWLTHTNTPESLAACQPRWQPLPVAGRVQEGVRAALHHHVHLGAPSGRMLASAACEQPARWEGGGLVGSGGFT